MNLKGIVYSYSVIHSTTEEFKALIPYLVVLLEDGHQKRLVRLEGDPTELNISIGAEIKLVSCKGSSEQCFQLEDAE